MDPASAATQLDEIGAIGESHVFRVGAGIYLVRLGGHLSFADSNALSDLIARHNKGDRRSVLYEVGPQFSGYDPELRKSMNNPALKGMTHIGIITSNAMLRMVAATVALGLRTAMGIPMATYPNVDAAVKGARAALDRAH